MSSSNLHLRSTLTFNIIVILFSCLGNTLGQDLRGDGKSVLIMNEAQRFEKVLYANAQQTDNQAHYDVRYYDIRLDIRPDISEIVGSVEIHADVQGDSIDRLEVNLMDDMNVNGITESDALTEFNHTNHIVTVFLNRKYAPGERIRVRIDYHGNPSQTGFGAFGFDRYNAQPMIWSLSEPFGARNWWPCKDIPSDKADSVDIRITVPANLIVASNGLLRSVTDMDGVKTYWWHEKYPIVTYLVSVAIHPYATFSDSVEVVPGSQMPIDYYVFPSRLEQAQTEYMKTKQMIEAFSELFGPYPFHEEKYGHAHFLGGAYMEHQTISSMRASVGEYTVAHELAHQWWGNLVTCRDFGHIWLNEGFATYAEALWAEYAYGEEAYWTKINNKKYMGEGTIFVTRMDIWSIFSGNLSYNKASWVLHMLRHVVGDSTFFQILRGYGSDPRFAYGTATTEDFKQICEEISGKELDDFFHQWIYNPYYPKYRFQYQVRDSSGFFITDINIDQIQTSTVLFHMPIDLLFEFVSGDTIIVVDNDKAVQTYRFTFPRHPNRIQLDPEGWILKEVLDETSVYMTGSHMDSAEMVLMGSHPNPFNSTTMINYRLSAISSVELSIFNVLGQRVKTLVDEVQQTGAYSVIWDGKDNWGNPLTSGLYFCQLKSLDFNKTIKIVKSR